MIAANTLQETKELAHDQYFQSLFDKEYRRLDNEDHIYLDYTGGGIYSNSQLKAHFDLMKYNTLGNPHSANPSSQLSTTFIDLTRTAVLDFFHADDYECIFTLNASHALKIVGESYPFSRQSKLLLTVDNHNSVNGLRNFCNQKGGKVVYSPLLKDLTIDDEALACSLISPEKFDAKLFAFPAQSNASGVKHDLQWVRAAQNLGWDVMLDASAYVSSSPLDLSKIKPDFVCLSFYKMFGYPTGIGCLLVKKKSLQKLLKPWISGCTVRPASVKTVHNILHNTHEKFEDGTVNYLSIPAVKTGLDYLGSIGMERIEERVSDLQKYTVSKLRKLRHTSGQLIVCIYGPEDRNLCGGTITMVFKDALGKKIPFQEIEIKAAANRFSLRGGCFSNPGVDEHVNQIHAHALNSYFSANIDGDYADVMANTGLKRGAIRISVGVATRKKDVDAFIDFVETYKNIIL